MGLSDRDYARPGRGGGMGRGGGYGYGPGGPRLRSFNNWLIIINIAVFILGNVLLGNVMLRLSYGRGYWGQPAAEQLERSVVRTDIQLRDPQQPGVFYHPVIDPQSEVTDPFGRPMVDTRTQRLAGEIGRERFTYRPVLDAIGHFSTGKAFGELQIWRFLTFQFLHANFVHLLFNLLGLWFVGSMVEERLGAKRYAALYLLCGAAGGLLYLVLNLAGYVFNVQLPFVLFTDPYTPLVGASAGVFGVLLAAAALYPRERILVMFVLPMRLRTAVYIFTALAAFNLLRGGWNAGGDAAHLGGALAGALLIRRPNMLDDIVEFFSFGKRRAARGRPPRPSPRPARRDPVPEMRWPGDEPDPTEVDRILAKVHEHGLNSLTDKERELLRRASGRSGP